MTITTTIIDMAHNLGFKVLAKSVETSEQLAFLQQRGCDYYQGFYYSEALTATAFADLLRNTAV
jgi:EAL domain-containing protein (putative c-di-GMP-specific phosphodiesterase class I)